MSKTIISSNQIRNLVILHYIGTSIVAIPAVLTNISKQNAWLTALIASIVSVFIVLIYNKLADKMQDMTLITYIETVLGKYIGKLISALFMLFLAIACSAQVWIMGNFVITQLMPETPPYVIDTLFMIVVVIAAKLGIEVVARTSEIVMPIIFIGFFIIIIALLPQIDFNYMLPILEEGFTPVFKGVIPYMGYTSLTLIVLLMFFPHDINDIEEGKKAFLKGTIIGGIVIIIITDISILVLGSEVVSRHIYPIYTLAKKIQVGEFLQRIEVVFAAIWFITVFYKLFIYFYALVFSTAQILKLKNYRIIVLPMAMIMIVLSAIIFPSTIYEQQWGSTSWLSLALTFALVLPIILLTAGKIRGK